MWERIQQAQVLRERIQHAMSRLTQDPRITRVNLTDQDAQAMKGRQGIMPGYNAQAMASPVAESSGGGMLITAANLAAGEQRGDLLVMPERYHPGVRGPYFKDEFVYDPATGSYLCPQGQRLPFRGLRRTNSRIPPVLSEFTEPQEQWAGLAQLTESAPKTPIPVGRCGLVP